MTLFKGIAPSISYSDPEYYKFKMRLYMDYIYRQVAAVNPHVREVMVKFNDSIQNATKAFARFGEQFLKLKEYDGRA